MKNILVVLSAICLLLLSCSKDEVEVISIDQKEVSMFSRDTKQLNLIYSTEALKTKTYKWTSRDEFVATVSESGLVTGLRIGETYVSVSTTDGTLKDSTKVTIIPKYNLYKEPYVGFGASMAMVKVNETRKLSSESTSLIYEGENSSVRMVVYLFTNNAMSGAAVFLANTIQTAEMATFFLWERYKFLIENDDAYYFTNNNGVIIVMQYDSSLGLVVMYMKDPNLKSAPNYTELFNKSLNEIKREYLLNKGSL